MPQQLLHKSIIFKIAQKVTNILGYFCKQNSCRELSKLSNIAQSGHTVPIWNIQCNLYTSANSFYAHQCLYQNVTVIYLLLKVAAKKFKNIGPAYLLGWTSPTCERSFFCLRETSPVTLSWKPTQVGNAERYLNSWPYTWWGADWATTRHSLHQWL